MLTYEYIQYYVEGSDEKKFIDVLKTDMGVLLPGKVEVFNPASKHMTRTRLLTLKKNTLVILVFDIDIYNKDILNENIKLLNSMNNVSEVIVVLQDKNIEDELVRCCNIKDARELFKAKSKDDFKSKLIKAKNLDVVLKKHKFDIEKLWSSNVLVKELGIQNQGELIKVLARGKVGL